MVDSAPRTGLGWLWSAFDAVRERVESDGDLLGRFVHDRDEQAFGELVRRLGPTVYGVCRRHLGNTADADDAFQATFLVLSRKAGTVNPPGKVAAWVYGVANLSARKLRQTRHRRLLRERAVHPLPDQPRPEKEMDSTLLPAVDEELGRLPENFRLPILMCGVRGMTVADAAAELGLPVGTVASRLSRGRAELAKRLAKRGITFGAVAVTGGWCELAAGVPSRLIERTVAVAAGDTLPPAVAALSSEVVNVMTWSPIRRLTAGLLCASGLVLAGGGGLMLQTGTAAPVPTATVDAKPTLDRVKLNDVSGLLRQESVRKEIGLSDDEYRKLAEYREGKRTELHKIVQGEMQAQIRAMAARGQGGGPGGFHLDTTDVNTKATQEMNAEYLKKVTESLKPTGVKRLKQAVLQASGPQAMLDRLVIRELQLTAEQEDKLDALLTRDAGDYFPMTKVAKMAEAREAEMIAALKVLTTEQKKKWDALVGPPLPTADLLNASPHSEESVKENAKAFQGAFGGGVIQIAPAVPAVPLVPQVAPPVEEKKEK